MAAMTTSELIPELIERKVEGEPADQGSGKPGRVYELYRRGEAYEVHLDGKLLCATDQPRNEQPLVELALAPLKGRDDVSVVLAGLGVGRTLRQILGAGGMIVRRVDVVEVSPTMVDWEKRFFCAHNGDAMKDPRVRLHQTSLGALIRQVRLGAQGVLPEEGAMAVIVDIDRSLDAPLYPGNEAHYTDDGLADLEQILRPGGVVCIWSQKREPDLIPRLTARFQNIAEVAVPVDADPGLDYVYRGRRAAIHPAKAN